MSREIVLSRVRTALKGPQNGDGPGDHAAATQRISSRNRNTIPRRASGTRSDVIAAFKTRMRRQQATVKTVAKPESVPAIVADLIKTTTLAPEVRMGSDSVLKSMPWHTVSGLTCRSGPAGPSEQATISRAIAGIAETGTLVLASGPENPVTLTFLPEVHIIVIREEDIVAGLEDAFDRVRARYEADHLPRTINLVSAPSRTGDIGGQLVMGAHGPRQLAILVLESGSADSTTTRVYVKNTDS